MSASSSSTSDLWEVIRLGAWFLTELAAKLRIEQIETEFHRCNDMYRTERRHLENVRAQ